MKKVVKRVNKTKEQLIQEANQKKQLEEIKVETAKQRKFIKETFYPFLLENSKDVKDTLNSLQMISGEINAAFQEVMMAKQKELSDGKLEDIRIFDRKFFTDNMSNEHFARDSRLLELFKEHKLNVAAAMISGMVNELKMFLNKEHDGRPLHTVKTEFLDEETAEKKSK